jgi:hypothetical protein
MVCGCVAGGPLWALTPRGVTSYRMGKFICCFFLYAVPCCVSLCAAVGPRPVVRRYQRAVCQGPDGDSV